MEWLLYALRPLACRALCHRTQPSGQHSLPLFSFWTSQVAFAACTCSNTSCTWQCTHSGLMPGNPLLSGSLPAGLGLLTSLQFLSLSSTSVAGTAPSALTQLSALTYLSLVCAGVVLREQCSCSSMHSSAPSVVQANANLSGSIPSGLSNMTQLVAQDWSSQRLTGRLPADWLGGPALRVADFSGNALTGSIPAPDVPANLYGTACAHGACWHAALEAAVWPVLSHLSACSPRLDSGAGWEPADGHASSRTAAHAHSAP